MTAYNFETDWAYTQAQGLPELKVPAEFFYKSVYQSFESEQKGSPIYKDILFIRKFKSRSSIFEGKATEQDKRDYAHQYAAFIANEKQKEQGVPIGMLPALPESMRDMLVARKIETVERLAQLNEVQLSEIGMGARELQKKAIAYLAQNSVEKQELEAARKEIEELKKIVNALQEKLTLSEVKNDTPNNGAKRGRRNKTVSSANNSNIEQQQGN